MASSGANNSWRSTTMSGFSESPDYKEFVRHSNRLNTLTGRGTERLGGGGGGDVELNGIFDQFNSLDYYTQFLKEPIVGCVLGQCCRLVNVNNSQLVSKYCQFLQNTVNRQKIILSHNLKSVVEHLLGALSLYSDGRAQSSKCLSDVLRALATVLYENVGHTKEFHEALLGSSGVLLRLADTKDVDVLRSLMQCLQNITNRVAGETDYLSVEHQENCIRFLLKTLQSVPNTSLDEVLICKILISTFKSLQNVLFSCKLFPADLIGPLLAALHVYMVYGLPGAPSVVPSSLYSVPLSNYYQDNANTTAQNDPKTPVDTTATTAKPASKRGKKNKAKDADTKSGSSKQDVPSVGDKLEASSQPDAGVAGGTRGFFAAFMSSDSECSDTEMAGGGGTVNRLTGSYKSRVRLHSLACFHALIKAVERRVMFGYWSSFIPDAPNVGTLPSKHTLFSVIMKDPSYKARCAALSVLTALLDGSKQYLQAAEDGDRYRNAPFTPFSVTLGHMIREMHRCLLLLLVGDESAIFTTQAIKCLSMLIGSVPYQRLHPGLLGRAVKQIRPYLAHRDPNIRVACLTCLGRVVSVQAPMLEVCHIIQPSRPSMNRLSERSSSDRQRTDTDSGSTLLPIVLESGYSSAAAQPISAAFTPPSMDPFTPVSTPVSYSGCHTPVRTGSSSSGVDAEMSWLVRLCLRNIAPQILSEDYSRRLEASAGREIVQPLPVRLESLQVLSLVTKGYFFIVRPQLQLVRELVELCLMDADHSVQLHGAKLLQVTGSMLLLHLQSSSASTEDVIQAADMWRPLLNGSVQTALEKSDEQTVRTVLCECLSNVGPNSVFELLPSEQTRRCVSLLMDLVQNKDNRVRAAAVNALGSYIIYRCLRKDVTFVADVANVLLNAGSVETESNLNVRWKAAWSLSNLTDALLLNRSEDDQEFMHSFSNMLLLKLFSTLGRLCTDNDKVRCNAVRAVGNLLSYLPSNCYESGRFSEVINEGIESIIKNVSSACFKVRWNACYAVGNMLRNDVIRAPVSKYIRDVFMAVIDAMKTCGNYKVRISAITCLSSGSERSCYGDAALYASLWASLLAVLSDPDAFTEYTEYKHRVNLTDQICRILIHFTILVTPSDLESLHCLLVEHSPLILSELEKFREPEVTEESNERLEYLQRAKLRLNELKTDETLSASQKTCLVLLTNVYSTETSVTTYDEAVDLSHTMPLVTGFRQMYD